MKILLIAPDFPWPVARHGSAQRTELLRRALEEFGDVERVVMPIAPTDSGRAQECDGVVAVFAEQHQRSGCFCGVLACHRKAMSAQRRFYGSHPDGAYWVKLADAAGKYDLIVVRYLRTAGLAGLTHASRTPWLLDFDDVDWLKQSADQPLCGSWRASLSKAMLRRSLEKRCRGLAAGATGIWVPSSREQFGIRPLQSSVLPNISMELLSRPQPLDEASRRVLFVGHMKHRPNVEGVDWFIDHCWEQVRRAVPDAHFSIVGGGIPQEAADRWPKVPGIRVCGFVNDLRESYRDSKVAICPIWTAGGSQIKVLEAMAHSRPVIVTPVVARAFGHGFGGILCGNDAAAFAHGVIRLLQDREEALRLGRAARCTVQTHYSFDAFNNIVAGLVRKACGAERANACLLRRTPALAPVGSRS